MDFVAIDLGASSTRYMSVDRKVNWLPNTFYKVKGINDNINNDKLDDIIENNLDVTIRKDGESEYFPARVLLGEMASRFAPVIEAPESGRQKTMQFINYASAIIATAVTKLKTKEVGDEVNLFIALPPLEVVKGCENLKNNLIGKFEVTFNKIGGAGGTTVSFSVKNIACYEESRLAILQYISTLSDPNEQANMLNSNIWSLDIGASTSDLAIFVNGKYINKAGITIQAGCNTAITSIINSYQAEQGKQMSKVRANTCLVEGRLPVGVKHYEDVREIVGKAKEATADAIRERMGTYFQDNGLTIEAIQYIVVSGGGSVASGYVDDNGNFIEMVPSMSKFVTDVFTKDCKYVIVVPFGDEPRLANIRGLGSIALRKNGEIVEE